MNILTDPSLLDHIGHGAILASLTIQRFYSDGRVYLSTQCDMPAAHHGSLANLTTTLDPLTMTRFPSSPILMDEMAHHSFFFGHFTWADHGSQSAACTSCVFSVRMILFSSRDGAALKTAPNSGQHCAFRLGKVCQLTPQGVEYLVAIVFAPQ